MNCLPGACNGAGFSTATDGGTAGPSSPSSSSSTLGLSAGFWAVVCGEATLFEAPACCSSRSLSLQAGKTSSPANKMATIIRISAAGIFDLLLDAPSVIVHQCAMKSSMPEQPEWLL